MLMRRKGASPRKGVLEGVVRVGRVVGIVKFFGVVVVVVVVGVSAVKVFSASFYNFKRVSVS
jgi:hypothetical protein